MPYNFSNIANEEKTPFGEVRTGIAACVEFACNSFSNFGVRVFPEWKFEIDPKSMLGKITPALKLRDGANVGKIHSWMVGVGAAAFDKGEDEEQTPYIGSNRWDWVITLDVWGFYDNAGGASSQSFAEDEAEIVSATIWANHDELVAGTSGLVRITPLDFGLIESQPFNEGVNVIVAQGTMQAYIQRIIQI